MFQIYGFLFRLSSAQNYVLKLACIITNSEYISSSTSFRHLLMDVDLAAHRVPISARHLVLFILSISLQQHTNDYPNIHYGLR